MSKHTKGPWFFDQYGHVYGTVDGKPIEGAIGKTILQPHVCTPSCIANARLIAAAPELLEALKVLVENGGIGPEQMFHDARAAIAKATGENT